MILDVNYLSKKSFILKYLLLFILISGSYYSLGIFGLKFATVNANASPVWLASGLATGMLAIFGIKYAPAIYLGALLTNYQVETPLLALFLISLGNMLEAVIGAKILNWLGQKSGLKHYSELVAITTCSLFASLASATIGVSSLYLVEQVNSKLYSYIWYTWWSGDAIGIMILLPLILELRQISKSKFYLSGNKIAYTFLLASFMLFVTALVFVEDYNQAYSWLLAPFFIIAGIKIGRLSSRILLLLISIVVILLTARGLGPFEQGNPNLNLIYVQCLILSYAFAILFVKPYRSTHNYGTKFITGIVLGWLSIFAVIFMSADREEDRMNIDIGRSVRQALEAITKNNAKYETLINSTKALIIIKRFLNQEQWNNFVASAKIEENFPAINGVGFVQQVSKENLHNELKEIRKRTNPQFNITSLDPNYAENFDNHLAMIYLAPYEKNKKAIGLDIGSERKRREAAWKSKRLSLPMATEPIKLIQDDKQFYNFALLTSVSNEDHTFYGWVAMPIVTQIYFDEALSQYSHILNIKIFINDQLIYSLGNNIAENQYFISKEINIFGQKHILKFYPRDLIFSRNSISLAVVALLLCIFMLFISSFLLELINFGKQAELMVQRKTKELEVSKMQLIHSSKMASLGEMASGMAHEINNPLTIIVGKIAVIRVMLEDLEIKNPTIIGEIDKIKETTDRIGKIIRGLRTFSRSSKEDPFELVPLDKIIEETLDLCKERFRVNDIEIKIDKIPKVLVVCRPGQISQILLNLFNNSFDAIENLHEKWIHLGFKVKANKRILISVTDSGHGIPEKIADKIMEPFFTTKEVKKGTGLGLSIVKGITESHGGQFWLDQDYPNTRFIVELKIETEK